MKNEEEFSTYPTFIQLQYKYCHHLHLHNHFEIPPNYLFYTYRISIPIIRFLLQSRHNISSKKKISNEKPSNGVPVLVKILKRNGVTEFSREKERKVLNITFNIVPSIPITRQSHAIIFSDRLGLNRPQPIFEMEINQRQGISDSHVVAINKLSMLETGSDSGSRVGLLLRRNE